MKNTYINKHKLLVNATQYNLYLFGIGVCVAVIYPKGGWIRLFGHGFYWIRKSEEMLFSERMGYRKFVIIGKYRIGSLKYHLIKKIRL